MRGIEARCIARLRLPDHARGDLGRAFDLKAVIFDLEIGPAQTKQEFAV